MSSLCNPKPCPKHGAEVQTDAPIAHVSLGAYGRIPHEIAIAEAIAHPPVDPLLGSLSPRKLQLCPQNLGCLDVGMAGDLRRQYPEVEWRLHANVRIQNTHQIIDLCDWPEQREYFQQLGRISKALDAPAYSLHAGKRSQATVTEVIRYSHELAQVFGVPVAIEGHYPTPRNSWLFSSWQEYRQLLESDACFALDLSHLNILASHENAVEIGLVSEMLSSERCLEIHVSANDGRRDQHLPLMEKPWWWPLLKHAHANAVVFSEGLIRA